MNNDGALKETLHWSNSDLEVHKVVVGPYENNVFVLRCKATGEGVLIDAANEHELLLELCEQLGVKRVLETHGHWDHIQAIPAMREAGYEVAVTRADAPRLVDVGYDVFLDDQEVVEIGRMRLHVIHNPGHTEGSISFQVANTPRGWMRADLPLLQFEQHLYLRQPGYGSSYITGKALMDRLLADYASQRGDRFALADFFADVGAAGIIPWPLVRLELTGLDDDIRQLSERE